MPDYVYEEQGRRPATIMVCVLAIAMLGFGLMNDGPWYFLAPVALAGILGVIAVIGNRRSGMILRDQELRFFSGSWSKSFDPRTVVGVRELRYSEGQPTIILLFGDGTNYRIPGVCFGASVALLDALRSRGIRVE
jgi:hypothetical protein